jgi:hypothetical protein
MIYQKKHGKTLSFQRAAALDLGGEDFRKWWDGRNKTGNADVHQ